MSFLDGIRTRLGRRPSAATLVALGIFAIALAVRLVWVAYVESPFDNVYSDMGGYINRALQAAYGGVDPLPVLGSLKEPDPHVVAGAMAGVDPWTVQCPLYPPGAHLVYAAEMRLVGWTHHGPYLFINCMWGAVVAPCTMLLALRIVPRLWLAASLGLVAAFWYPVLCFAGFFSSEQPYAGALALSAWLLVRQVESGKSPVALGVASSIAYLVRPQVVLTLAALGVVGLLIHWRRPARAPLLRIGRLTVAGGVLAAAIAFGAVRYHALSGHWGLISDNQALTRLWADTNYGRVSATWHAPDGWEHSYFFESPPKNEIGEHRELHFDGYLGDAKQLDQARRVEVATMTARQRAIRWIRNVRLLFKDDSLWPDSTHAKNVRWRRLWSEGSRRVFLVGFVPLAVLGMISCAMRPRTVSVVCTAHVVTAIVVAAFFFAEARYRVPYDMFVMLLAIEGGRALYLAWRGKDEPA